MAVNTVPVCLYQEQLVQRLLGVQELTLAADFCTQFSLSSLLCPAIPLGTLEAEAARYLRLRLAPEAVVIVDSAARLQAACDAMAGAEAVGLDSEWVPAGQGPMHSHLGVPQALEPALLQV